MVKLYLVKNKEYFDSIFIDKDDADKYIYDKMSVLQDRYTVTEIDIGLIEDDF